MEKIKGLLIVLVLLGTASLALVFCGQITGKFDKLKEDVRIELEESKQDSAGEEDSENLEDVSGTVVTE